MEEWLTLRWGPVTPRPLLLLQKVNCQPAQWWDDLLQADIGELTEMEVVWLR